MVSEQILTPQMLERLRQSGISIDRDGYFWHEGQRVSHQGLKEALYRWLDVLPDGRVVLRLDERRFVYVDVADTPLVIRSARWQSNGLLLSLSDGSEERLNPNTLTIDNDGVLRAWVRTGKLEARLSTAAAAVLAERVDGDSAPPRLHIDGTTIEIPVRPDPAPAPSAKPSLS